MFKDIDLLIGFVLLMLAAGTVVAAGTQSVAALTGMRAHFLRQAVEELLQQLDPCRLSPGEARRLARFLLRHPRLRGRGAAYATYLRREDFVLLLVEIASGCTEFAAPLRCGFVFSNSEEALERSLSIGAHTLRLELDAPAENARDRSTRAIIAALGPHPLLAQIHAWYGHAMARATERYMRLTRLVASAISLALVVAMRLDLLACFHLPAPGRWPGMALSWVLLSLGTPFWYDRLKDLLHFRPES
jgi:hypothetical protein